MLHEFHRALGGRFVTVGAAEVVSDYGDALGEYAALSQRAAVLDLSFRSRICLTGGDRARFLHGQVTNDVNRLRTGEGCYAALITAKGKMQSDLNIYCLQDELLLDFEPGLTAAVTQRLEKYVVADDVGVVDVAPLYGLWSVQGPRADTVVRELGILNELPSHPLQFSKVESADWGEIYLVNQPRHGTSGFDLFIPNAALGATAEKLVAAVSVVRGRPCGWQAAEMARIEAGIPRFGVDVDETNIPLEAGLDRAISSTKGCYIGQEVISRIRTYGQVAKSLRGLRLADDLEKLPVKGDKLFRAGKEVGYITSALASPALKQNLAFGYVRRQANEVGTDLVLRTAAGESLARVVELPFIGGIRGSP